MRAGRVSGTVLSLGPQEGSQQKQAADNGKAAEQLGKKRRCKHDNFLQITKMGLCFASHSPYTTVYRFAIKLPWDSHGVSKT